MIMANSVFFYQKKIKNNIRNIPPVEHQFRILKMLGIDYDPALKLELFPSPKDEAYVQELLDSEWLSEPQVFVGLNISASKNGPLRIGLWNIWLNYVIF
jgi:hypothetical protein